jgi:hypothetical protein
MPPLSVSKWLTALVALASFAAGGCVAPRKSPITGPDAADIADGPVVNADAEPGDAPAEQAAETDALADAREDAPQSADAPDAAVSPDLARDTSFSEDPGFDAGTTKSVNGAACSSGTTCTSGSCVDGVCCESACTGQCEACAESGTRGRCVAVTGDPRGTRTVCAGKGSTCGGTCDGSGRLACSYPGTQKECVAASCTGGTATVRSGCDGHGACPTAQTVPCAPFMCDGNNCAGGCSAASPCTAGNYCEAGRCNPKKTPGSQCLDGTQCASGYCVDGVCCQTACDGACQSCNAGTAGTCGAVKSADDDHCNGQLTCDAAGACKRRRGSGCTGTGDCASGFCVDGVCCDRACAGQCEGCAEPASPGTCVTVTGAPRSPRAPCGGTAECAGTCAGGSTTCAFPAVACGPAASCNGSVLSRRGLCSVGSCQPGGTQDCSPYACSASSGSCPGSCSSDGDCAAGFACRMGKCATPPSPAVSVGSSSNGSCAVLMNGKVVCWGSVPSRPAGLGPFEVPGVSNAVRVTLDFAHICVLTSDHKVLCWGGNGGGQLGDGTTTPRDTPGPVPSNAQPWTTATELCSVDGHSLAVVGGTVFGWGINPNATLGQPTTTSQIATPLALTIPGIAGQLACNVSTGSVFTSMMKFCAWGNNGSQLASPDTMVNVVQPPLCVNADPSAPSTAFAELTGGGFFTCGRLTSGGYRCWGDNNLGQYGMGTSSAGGPYPGMASTGVSIKRIAASNHHACAIFADNRLRCWGGNPNRELGSGSTNVKETTPQQVLDLGADIVDVSGNAFAFHTCAVRMDGSVWCWGGNDSGQVGTGSTSTFVDRPTRVSL